VIAGALAIAGVFVLNGDDHSLFHSLLSGRALPAVIVSAVVGLAALVLVFERRYELARYAASLAVAAIIAGWALARWPTILPNLTVDQAAAGHDILVSVVVVVVAGAVILLPSLVLLFRLTLTGRFRARELTVVETTTVTRPALRAGLLARVAVACLIAGAGLLNLADAQWAHVIGVTCLISFVGIAFCAIVVPALDEQASSR